MKKFLSVQKLVQPIVSRLGTALLVSTMLLRPCAAAVKLPPSSIHKLRLPNGLLALFVEDHDSPVTSVEVWYHVGSKDEVPGRTGFAHLFEHLMYQGTKNLAPEEFSDYVIRYGGLDNAYTTEDMTVFWETFPSSVLPVVLWLEADRMRNLQITDKVFKNEREVVKEERRERFDNQPYGTVIETLYEHAYTVHPYRHMTIGSMEDLDHASVADVQAFYDRYYVPNNAVLVIVGDFETAKAESLVRQNFAALASGREPFSRAARDIPPEPRQNSERAVRVQSDVSLPAFVEGYHMPADGTPDAYPLRLAAKILSEGQSSRIYRRLVYDKQLAVQAQSEGNFTEDPNLFFVMVVLTPGHIPAEAEAQVDAELERLKAEPVTAKELEKAKNQVLRDFIISRQTDQSRAEELGYAAVVLKDPDLLDPELGRFLSVTPADIQRVARQYFVPQNRTIVEVYPKVGAGKS